LNEYNIHCNAPLTVCSQKFVIRTSISESCTALSIDIASSKISELGYCAFIIHHIKLGWVYI